MRVKVAVAKGEMQWWTGLQTRRPKPRRLPTTTRTRISSIDTLSISPDTIAAVNRIEKEKEKGKTALPEAEG